VGQAIVISSVNDSSFDTPSGFTLPVPTLVERVTAGSAFFVTQIISPTEFQYIQPGTPPDASSAGGNARIATFAEAYLASGLDSGRYKIDTQQFEQSFVSINNYTEGGQFCKYGKTGLTIMGVGNGVLDKNGNVEVCAASQDWVPYLIGPQGASNISRVGSLTTTAAGYDIVNIAGINSLSHCTLTATNATAAANIATTFVSAKTHNQVTISHAHIAGMDYDIQCTTN
jgi:hypothetical protein